MLLNKPIFNEAAHTYTNQKDKWLYTSVTTLVGKYKPKFDDEYWSLYNAGRRILGISDENKKQYSGLLLKAGLDFSNKTISNLKKALEVVLGLQYVNLYNEQTKEKQNWKDITKVATDNGTRIHKEKEDHLISLGYGLTRHGLSTKVHNIDLSSLLNLYELEDGIYPELMIWNNNHKVSGISDKVTIETVGNIRYVDIDDYKTNKKIDTESYCNKVTGQYQKMLTPVQELDDCNYIHYSVQLSIYAYFLELFGFKIRNIKFTHLILDEDKNVKGEQVYEVAYLRSAVIAILEDHGRRYNK